MKIRYTIELNIPFDNTFDEEQLDKDYYSPDMGFQEDLENFINDNEFTYFCNHKIRCEDEYCIKKNQKKKR